MGIPINCCCLSVKYIFSSFKWDKTLLCTVNTCWEQIKTKILVIFEFFPWDVGNERKPLFLGGSQCNEVVANYDC